MKKSCANCVLCRSVHKELANCGYHDKYFDLDRAKYCDDYEEQDLTEYYGDEVIPEWYFAEMEALKHELLGEEYYANIGDYDE